MTRWAVTVLYEAGGSVCPHHFEVVSDTRPVAQILPPEGPNDRRGKIDIPGGRLLLYGRVEHIDIRPLPDPVSP